MGENTPAPSPGRSYYGFVLYLLGWAGITLYLTWAFVPHSYLASVGLTYMPQPYWALALPSLIITLLVMFVFCIYPAVNLLLVAPPHDIRTITDSKAVDRGEYSELETMDVPPAYDLPISEVCRTLYYQL